MEQYGLIEKLRDLIIEDGLADAVYLSGEFASGSFDKNSIVIFNAVVSDQFINSFFNQRMKYLSAFSNIIHLEEKSTKVICCVYDAAITLVLNVVQDFNYSEEILVLYDKYSTFKKSHTISYSFSPSELGEVLSNFCMIALDFNRFYSRDEVYKALVISGELLNSYSKIIRYSFDDDKAKLGLLDFNKFLNENTTTEESKKIHEITNKLKIETQLESVKRMFISIDQIVNKFPILIAEYINFDFYLNTKKLIMSIT